MQDLRITLVQADQVWEDKTANLTHFSELLETVEETDLIVLPEMFNTGFSMHAETLAEDAHSSPSIDWLKSMASRKQAAVYTSMMIRDQGRFFNRGIFVYPDGAVTQYDKRKTFGLAGEDKVFTSGNESRIALLNGWKIQLQICYDLRFPEISLNKISGETAAFDLLIYVANWPERRRNHWMSLLVARAIENQCYVAGVNRVGTDAQELDYSGDSMLIDSLGETCMHLRINEAVKTVVLSGDHLVQTRTRLPFLKDRHV